VDSLQVRERIQLDNGFRPWQFTPDEKGGPKHITVVRLPASVITALESRRRNFPWVSPPLMRQ
jgi:hypothetical protein